MLILQSSLEETAKIGKLLETLLALARLDSSSVSLAKDTVDIAAIMRDILDDMEILAHQKGIEIDFVSQEGIILPIDKDQIMRSFINILENAIKYTPEKGRITVEVIRENSYAIITITDTGIGIPDQDLPHIFDRFYQADSSRSSAGFGLGLSIALSIIEAHGGSITVESTPNKGTTFLVSIPMGGLDQDFHPAVPTPTQIT